jgi:chromosome partitioning protein
MDSSISPLDELSSSLKIIVSQFVIICKSLLHCIAIFDCSYYIYSVVKKIIAITNQKGGVGKTTTAVSLAAGLKVKEKRPLLVDLDSQGNASAAFGYIIEDATKTVKDLLTEKQPTVDYIIKTDLIDLIPSNNSLKDIEDQFFHKGEYDLLKRKLNEIENDYDYIILDCPPSINVFTKCALTAADQYLIPVDVGYFSILGLKQLLEEIEHIKQDLNPSLTLKGVLPCKVDKRTTLSAQIIELLNQTFPEQIFKTSIRVNIDIVRSQIAQKNIFQYNAASPGAKDYLSLTEEILYGD